jgi:hypothetical protein
MIKRIFWIGAKALMLMLVAQANCAAILVGPVTLSSSRPAMAPISSLARELSSLPAIPMPKWPS